MGGRNRREEGWKLGGHQGEPSPHSAPKRLFFSERWSHSSIYQHLPVPDACPGGQYTHAPASRAPRWTCVGLPGPLRSPSQ